MDTMKSVLDLVKAYGIASVFAIILLVYVLSFARDLNNERVNDVREQTLQLQALNANVQTLSSKVEENNRRLESMQKTLENRLVPVVPIRPQSLHRVAN